MEAKATIKYIRIGPRKVRPILDLIRKKHVKEAVSILKNMNKKGARLTHELLKSAIANAKVKKMDETALFISDIRADGGPILKRLMTRSMGRADRLLKRTSHIRVTLVEKIKIQKQEDDDVREKGKKTKKKKTSKPTKATAAKQKTPAKKKAKTKA